jgi:hypothetical protein
MRNSHLKLENISFVTPSSKAYVRGAGKKHMRNTQ